MKKIHKQVAVICTFRTQLKRKHFVTESPGGKAACVHGRECIGVAALRFSSHVHSFQDEEEATNDAVCFFLQQRSHEKKQMTVILGLELTNITSCSSPTNSIHGCSHVRVVYAKAFFLEKCYSL